MSTSKMVAYWVWASQKISSYIVDFEQIKKLTVVLLTLNKPKIY